MPGGDEVRYSGSTLQVIRGNMAVKLSTTQFLIFKRLFEASEMMLSNDDMISAIWRPHQEPEFPLAAIGVHIYYLRRLLAPLGIVIHRPRGYKSRCGDNMISLIVGAMFEKEEQHNGSAAA
jgi:DNA-binding response OmpR family regulator